MTPSKKALRFQVSRALLVAGTSGLTLVATACPTSNPVPVQHQGTDSTDDSNHEVYETVNEGPVPEPVDESDTDESSDSTPIEPQPPS